MGHAAFTGYIDLAQLVLYAFWLFFAGLIFYLHREDKREGYPLTTEHPSGRVVVRGFPDVPPRKTFLTRDHGPVLVPRPGSDRVNVALAPSAYWPGAPLEPTGNPLIDGVGPASYANREDVPELTADQKPAIVPLRVAEGCFLASEDPDPRGMEVRGADGVVAGTVRDVWVDRAEVIVRYLEVALTGSARIVLLPMAMARLSHGARVVRVQSLMAAQFSDAPQIKTPDRVTKLEEDKIVGYFAGGHLYAEPSRLGPLL